MKKTLNLLIATVIISLMVATPAQADLIPGHLDTGFDPGSGANDTVMDIAVQADGKVLIVGKFTSFDGTATYRIARLNADGTLDTSFNPYTGVNPGADNRIRTVAVQEDGMILIGGDFTKFNNIPCHRIARLSSNGAVDANFNPGTGSDNPIRVVKILSTGKILIGGDFDTVNGIPHKGLARLTASGSLDTSFSAGINGSVYDIEPLSSGKIMVVGSFSTVDGKVKNRIARLNVNGSLDESFGTYLGANGHRNVLHGQRPLLQDPI